MSVTTAAKSTRNSSPAAFLRRHRGAVSVAVTIGALGSAVGAALLTGSRIGPVAGTVEGLASSSSTFLAKLGQNLPAGYAVGAGMVAAVNPCGFPMLPAYLGLFVGTGTANELKPAIAGRVLRAIIVSLSMTAAFVMLFAAAGFALSRGLHAVTQAFPAIGLAVGILMVLLGGWMVAGRTLYVDLGERAADRFRGVARGTTIPAYFGYGIAYGLVSLSCTLPIFLVVVGGAATSAGPGAAVLQFILYAIGMGLVITILTVGVSLLQAAVLQSIRLVLPLVQPISAALLLIAGAYLVFYWMTVGGVLRSAAPS
jgi:cytochrome c-type biogenesis protein